MSDKFFFNGRQLARQDHTGYSYQTKGSQNGGSQKYPLQLVVTNDARKQEIEAQVAKAQLHAQISIDTSEGAEESIAALTALLNKEATVKLEKTPTRNDPCSCGSGKKYKKCCG